MAGAEGGMTGLTVGGSIAEWLEMRDFAQNDLTGGTVDRLETTARR